MTKRDLKVLTGGRRLDVRSSNKHFISAYVTDTRLMGVLAVYAHWHVDNLMDEASGEDAGDDNVTWGDLHQFFYIDCEESGIETYHSVRESDQKKVNDLEQTIIGGLGASKIPLDELQLRDLMWMYREFNEEHQLPLPEGEAEYDFIFSGRQAPDQERRRMLMDHICPKIETDYQLINYFLMRCFGRDLEGARFLCADEGSGEKQGAGRATVPVDLYCRYEKATFWRNVIDERGHRAEGCREYLCESIVEENGRYDTVISLLTVKDLKVTGLQCRSISPMTQIEATMAMRKDEFLSLYDVLLNDDEMEENLDEFSIGFHATESECENGRLFMSYKPNNDHVNNRIFQLNDDVGGLIFITKGSQLILAAYDEPGITILERKLYANVLAPHLRLRSRYEFKTPILYGFMHSDIDYFQTYMRMILDENGDD